MQAPIEINVEDDKQDSDLVCISKKDFFNYLDESCPHEPFISHMMKLHAKKGLEKSRRQIILPEKSISETLKRVLKYVNSKLRELIPILNNPYDYYSEYVAHMNEEFNELLAAYRTLCALFVKEELIVGNEKSND